MLLPLLHLVGLDDTMVNVPESVCVSSPVQYSICQWSCTWWELQGQTKSGEDRAHVGLQWVITLIGSGVQLLGSVVSHETVNINDVV